MILDTPELVELPLDEVHPADDNVRHELRGIKELAATFAGVGIIEPLVVTPNGDGYMIVAGNRRHAAAKVAKLSTVPCVIRAPMAADERIETMALENLARDGLTVLEEAEVYQRLVDLGWTQRKIAEHFGCNQSHVSKRIQLLELPDPVRERINDGRVHVDVGVKLVQLKKADPKRFERYVKNNPSPSAWSIDNKLDTIKTRKQHEKLAKPYVDKGLKLLGRMDWMKYEDCTEKQATAIYVDYSDRIKFVRPKPVNKETPSAPRKETKKQREAREAAEAAAAARAAREQEKTAAFAAVVHDDDLPVWTLLASWMLEVSDFEGDELDRLCTVLELAPVGDLENMTWPESRAAVDAANDRLDAYLATDELHAQRLAIGLALSVSSWRGDRALAEKLRLAGTHGYDLDDDEKKLVEEQDRDRLEARERGYTVIEVRTCRICGCTDDLGCEEPCSWVDDPAGKGDLCSNCFDAVGTVHDPDAPTSGAELRADQLRKDLAFADEHDLQPGDVVHEDGSITRANA